MACFSCGSPKMHFVEGFQCTKQTPTDAPHNRCPKTFPTQTCIYTTQGMIVCNSKGNEPPHVTTDIELNIHQPFYHQTLQRALQKQ